MFEFSQLEVVELEITNRCQASCPMCPRNIHGGIENPLLKINDWTIDNFKNIFSVDLVKKIKNFTFCGNFGDPLLNNDIVSMLDYITFNNKNVYVSIHTNGSLRSRTWWKDLVKVLPKNHDVIFALDGLADTHHLYRIGTDFTKIIENASSFINAGGNANWQFIKFNHNKHQVEDAKQLSTQLGFKKFILKNTRRFTQSKFKVVDKKGMFSHFLKPAEDTIKIVDKNVLLNEFNHWKNTDNIFCKPKAVNAVYIDCHYTLVPCCIIASWFYTSFDERIYKMYNLHDVKKSVNSIGEDIRQEVFQLVRELGGFEFLNVLTNSIEDILSSDIYNKIWEEKWRAHQLMTCSLMCSADSPFITLDEQKVKNV